MNGENLKRVRKISYCIKNNNEKGITMIALVATLIILLILVSVSILYDNPETNINETNSLKEETESQVNEHRNMTNDLLNDINEDLNQIEKNNKE